MTDQQFCLRWNNHQSTLVAVFDGLLEKGVLVDCTLAAEGQQLTAHKVVLAACSPFLEVSRNILSTIYLHIFLEFNCLLVNSNSYAICLQMNALDMCNFNFENFTL